MKYFLLTLLCLVTSIAVAEDADYMRMDADLARLKADFNASADQLRLMYIVGPT